MYTSQSFLPVPRPWILVTCYKCVKQCTFTVGYMGTYSYAKNRKSIFMEIKAHLSLCCFYSVLKSLKQTSVYFAAFWGVYERSWASEGNLLVEKYFSLFLVGKMTFTIHPGKKSFWPHKINFRCSCKQLLVASGAKGTTTPGIQRVK